MCSGIFHAPSTDDRVFPGGVRFIGKRREQGVAIVLILAFLVLLTGLIIAFFSRAAADRQVSNSSASQSKADTLARGALDVITGDLKQEIALGSKTDAGAVSYSAKGIRVYPPLSNTYVVPTRSYPGLSASNDPVPNLIRESGTSNAAVTVNATPVGVDGGAAAALSTTPSLNGRKVGLARWNSHYLAPRLTPSNTALDATPVAGFTAPSWVTVTNQGPTVLAAPATSVIGRYAYAIYDEGGLLDVNVAGYPSTMTIPQTGEKGLLAFADLTNLPTAVPSPAPYLPAAQVNNLVGWRNYATTQPSGTLAVGYGFDTSAATRYLNFLLNSTGAFLSVNPQPFPSPATTASRTDQTFTSRQALLRFWNTLIANSNSGTLTDSGHLQNVLPYLGTFSRELNAPSWSPVNPINVPPYSVLNVSTYDYAGNAETPSASYPNADIPNVRFAKNGSLTRYRLDGTPYTKTFDAGDSLVQMRFPLGRIAWLTTSAASTVSTPSLPGLRSGIPAQAVLTHFGLNWDSTNSWWVYKSGSGTLGDLTPVSAIKTLDQVAKEGREPDFFELLKAGILSGSLGKTALDPSASPVWKKTVSTYLDTAANDVNSDLQILRIGANIIDQASPSMMPTDIFFNNNEVGQPVHAYGIKSLPYIAWIPYVCHRPENGTGSTYDPARKYIGLWFCFEVWDPHQNADPQNPNLLPVGSPTNFRIVPLQGAAALEVSGPGGNLPNFPTVPLDTTSYITFTRNNSASRTFADPTFLTLAFASSNKAVNMCPITHAAISGGVTQSAPGALQGNPGFVGFNAGLWPQPDQRLSGVATDPILNGMREPFPVDPSQWPIFALQAQVPSGDGSGAWHTIQVVEHLVGNDPGSEVMTWNPAFQYLATQIAVYNPDPRTERFGAFGGHGISNMGLIYNGVANSGAIQQNGPALGSAIQGTFDGVTGWLPAARHAYQVGAGGGGYPNVIVSSLALNNLASVSTAYNSYWVAYTDPDGILREGDATGYTVTAARARYPMIPDTGVSTTTHDGDRPVVLNRPYRSVGELGYAYRDMPWKTLDFFTKNSADGALLDLFTTSDAEVTAGRLDLNTRNVPVLQSMLASAITTELAPLGATAQLSLNAAPTVNSQAAALATTLVNWTTNKTDATQGPLLNRADLTRAFGSTDLGKPTTNQAINLDVKTQREVTVRALAESGVTRTWNLLIDIVAQAGHYPPGATTMDKFNVEGERRYWLHVAIDRFTGQVIDQQLESVYE